MSLRAATSSDVDAIAQIMGDWFSRTDFVPRLHTAKEDQGFADRLIKNNDVMVAADGGMVCGFIARDGVEIGQLYVAANARGHGTGSALLDIMKTRAATLELWCFQANTGARRFYDRHGFVATKFTDGADNEERVPDVRYVWSTPV